MLVVTGVEEVPCESLQCAASDCQLRCMLLALSMQLFHHPLRPHVSSSHTICQLRQEHWRNWLMPKLYHGFVSWWPVKGNFRFLLHLLGDEFPSLHFHIFWKGLDALDNSASRSDMVVQCQRTTVCQKVGCANLQSCAWNSFCWTFFLAHICNSLPLFLRTLEFLGTIFVWWLAQLLIKFTNFSAFGFISFENTFNL